MVTIETVLEEGKRVHLMQVSKGSFDEESFQKV